MSYHVKLDQFEGPLDLLLHLISKAKVHIEDISITEITQQYMETLDAMKQFDIEVASEFLVMAATLLHIKSCILVPKVKSEMEEEGAIDPKEELIIRLLEYKRYKEASGLLQKRESYYSGIFYKLPEEFYSEKDTTPFDISSDALYDSLLKLLSNKKILIEKIPMIHRIKRDPMTINERISQLKKYFSHSSETTFFNLFENQNNKNEIIITFLALLEMLKENFLELHQVYPFDDIVIKRRITNG